uniref:Uncharacterized protein n=1 Tax=virus sp. ctiha2 TaxID=2827299 RepID=A0A8S5RHT4_9VIRU|nr:MAG TPA: hypothetical protein [virus sp. ctiha2]
MLALLSLFVPFDILYNTSYYNICQHILLINILFFTIIQINNI